MLVKKNFICSVLIPALVSGIISAVVGFLMYTYQSQQEYNSKYKPLVKPYDYTEEDGGYGDTIKDVFFHLAIRNSTILKISMSVDKKEFIDDMYLISMANGRGGGFDTSKINVASVRIENDTNKYLLLDLKKGINKFRKDSIPFYVDYRDDFSNEFFRVFLRKNDKSVKIHVSVDIEWEASDQSLGGEVRKKTVGPHEYMFVNPIPADKIIHADLKKVIANNLTGNRHILDHYFKRKYNNVEVEYRENGEDQSLVFDNGLILILNKKYSSHREMNFNVKKEGVGFICGL